MRIMSDYTILCTETQTRKALELGAPILNYHNAIVSDSLPHYIVGEIGKDWNVFICSTAEQMLGWLESQHPIDHIDIYKQITTWRFCVYTSTLDRRAGKGDSRQEATLAAIDSALEYLSQNKK